MSDLSQRQCKPCEGGMPTLASKQSAQLLKQLADGWHISDDGKEIRRDFKFHNFYRSMAFTNAVAWIANKEGHHPDLEIGYGHCLVRYTTHAIGGLSENDFICAAKIDQLLEGGG